ncbi:MAG: HAD family phosphatase [Candidatus Sumerlaeota bacterium]|nr:HAD family phosphatase [Candidatus Sumerlaeota bacterium]
MRNRYTQRGFGVIFDSDGVVVDSEELSLGAFRRVFEEQGIDLTDEDVESVVGQTDQFSIERMNRKYGCDIDLAFHRKRKFEIYRQMAAERGIRAFPGVARLLDELDAAGVPYALASSGSLKKIELNMELAGLAGRFRLIIHGGDVRTGKPDPEAFVLAAQRLGLPPARCVVVEDAYHGTEAAQRAGMPCLAVTNTFPAHRLRGATRVVATLEDVGVDDLARLVEGASAPRLDRIAG